MYENETGSHFVYLIFSRRFEGWNLFICVPCFSLRFKEMDLLREREKEREEEGQKRRKTFIMEKIVGVICSSRKIGIGEGFARDFYDV